MNLVAAIGQALLMAAGMFWQTAWSLVLGFTVSSLLQATVPADAMRRTLGGSGPREIAIATAAGAASSSCSYASAAIMRTLFKKGASLVASLAFLFASTNLVLELGIILILLLGWQFAAAEWLGGVVLIVILSILVKLTLSPRLEAAARAHREEGQGHEHMVSVVAGATWRARLANPDTRVKVAQNFVMEWRMLWKDVLAGFVIAGALATFVPDRVWSTIFLAGAPPWVQTVGDALIGPLVAVVTFVCSIGNVPLAAVLWSGGASFGGVIAFLSADLIILPLLDVYRRYFGWRMMLFMAAIFYAAMAAAALIVDLVFKAIGIVPQRGHLAAQMTTFSLNYTFWLNLIALGVAAWLFIQNRRHPMDHSAHHAAPA
jgi:uncharacterized membrane protein YraQ (UPF0718 family)